MIDLLATATKRKVEYHLRWAKWADDMMASQITMTGWPDDIPHPGGKEPWKVFEKEDNNKVLWDALCGKAQSGVDIEFAPWTDGMD
jgi:hypothetical protein